MATAERDELIAALGKLQDQHPQWDLWATANLGYVVATRLHRSAGPSRTVVEDTVELLAKALEQEKRDATRLGLF